MLCLLILLSLSVYIEVLCMCLDVALAPNNNEVQIHQLAAGKWKLLETLSEHGQRVTGIDWAPTSNRIVTCGAVSYSEPTALSHHITLHVPVQHISQSVT